MAPTCVAGAGGAAAVGERGAAASSSAVRSMVRRSVGWPAGAARGGYVTSRQVAREVLLVGLGPAAAGARRAAARRCGAGASRPPVSAAARAARVLPSAPAGAGCSRSQAVPLPAANLPPRGERPPRAAEDRVTRCPSCPPAGQCPMPTAPIARTSTRSTSAPSRSSRACSPPTACTSRAARTSGQPHA